jgi:catechol 2,3-dioxygenase-like lactoylglutathione lyase family enzyme
MVEIALDHVNVTVPVGATDEFVAFYEAAFGFTRVEKPPGGRRPGAWLQITDDVQLHLTEHEAAPNPQAHFAIRVADVDAVEATVRDLGADVEPLAERGRGRRVLVRDPAGNGIEVCGEG